MDKILSVCVPSYNMEKYLRRNLDSFIASSCFEDLEVIVVNDGSNDATLQIASGYEEKFPNTITVIDKPNGHYGSCINAALKIAKGKYFRVVDADDWVNSESLRKFIEILKQTEADCFITRFSKFFETDGSLKLMPMTSPELNKVLEVDSIKVDPTFLHMHCITWNIDYLHSLDYSQTEGICYTDLEYACIPLMSARTVFFTDLELYQYCIGRNDQSVAPSVVNKNFSHFVEVYKKIDSYNSNEQNKKAEEIRKRFLQILFGFMTPSHIFYNYNNEENDAFLRGEISKHLSNGATYTDFVFSNSASMAKYVKMWFKPNPITRIILGIQRCRINK